MCLSCLRGSEGSSEFFPRWKYPLAGGSTNPDKINFVNERDDEAKSFPRWKDTISGEVNGIKQSKLYK